MDGQDVVRVRKGRLTNMRLTIEQRVAALERENVVLQDTMKLLHKLLRENRQLIKDYVTQRVAARENEAPQNGPTRPEDALYAFVCRRRFDKIDSDIDKLRKRLGDLRPGLRAG